MCHLHSSSALLTVHDVRDLEVWVTVQCSVCAGEETLHILCEVPAPILIKYRKQDDISLV